ncbi:MAG TPA: DoxX family protein [Tepidisphaeraceae bacterium]|jgi:hypothetical protein|nr:DoxX family protein [Tepidisphaeraceae bacterium]
MTNAAYGTMPAVNQPSKATLWIGRVLSALPVLMLIMSASFKLAKVRAAVEGFKQFGWPEELLVTLGIIELSCAILYAIPATSVLGAVLLTGYLGGAVATHFRVKDIQAINAVVLGIVLWLGLFLREPRLRSLIPLRR